ncbi:hypothetical protein ACFLRA_03445 [Bdellovibrionota bacterium]
MISHICIDEKYNQAQTIVTAQFSDFDEFILSFEPDISGGGVFLETEIHLTGELVRNSPLAW